MNVNKNYKVIISVLTKRTDNTKSRFTANKANEILKGLNVLLVNNNNIVNKKSDIKVLHLTLKRLVVGVGGQFDTPCGFSKYVSSEERVKPGFL